MGNVRLTTLREQALELTDGERAELAHDLLASLDGAPDADAAAAWDAELMRRLDRLDAGSATTVDRAEFSRRMQERLRRL
jgi:putative addiction module component (TIGR02574 family)